MTKISTPYVSKPKQGQFLRYSFNGQDFFTSATQALTYLPDLLI